ncbi:sulfotransferase [Candidatus Acetothermia bacterium]|nr:sulfotransferase [Candidatus Acetothermia bacterium]
MMPQEGPCPDPLFILCKGRSGSTFLVDILIRHPEIGMAPVSDLIRTMLQAYPELGDPLRSHEGVKTMLHKIFEEPKFETWELKFEILLEELVSQLPLCRSDMARAILLAYHHKNYPGRKIWGLKRGGWLATHIHTLRRHFPQSKYLLLIRDGRAVFASSKRAIHSDTSLPLEEDSLRSAQVWKKIVSSFISQKDQASVLIVRYEDLVTEPREIIAKILWFLGVTCNDDVMDNLLFSHTPKYIYERDRHLHENVGKAPQKDRASAWKKTLSPKEIKTFEKIAAKELVSQGYDLLYPASSLRSLFFHMTKEFYREVT